MRRFDTLTLFRPPNWRGGLPHCPCIGRRFGDRSAQTLHSHSLVALCVLPSYTLVAVALEQRYIYILVDLYVVPSTVPAVGKPLQH